MNLTSEQRSEQWATVIQPHTGWFNFNFSELWRYRDLVAMLVRRDFVTFYKQTILGPTWFLLQPLLTTIMFTVVFGNIAHISTNGLPQILFYMSGIVLWNYFAMCLTNTSSTFITNAAIFGKVYFPRLAVPVSVVITNLITFAIQFCLFLAFMLYFYLRGAGIRPNMLILILPLLLFQLAALGLGIGILISSLTTKYRDLTYLVTFGVQLWMYATPVVYPMSLIPRKWQWVYALNPMASVIETFRYAFLGAGAVQFSRLALSFGMTIVILLIGVILFSRIERTFMDTV